MAIDLFYPHPEYDFKATERWLEKKARKGRHLVPGGNLNGFAAFEKGEPAQVRYRLVPTGRSGYRRADDDPPAEEVLELYSQMGWEYVTTRGVFYIFRTEKPDAPEPDTDPQVLALALKPTVRRALWETIFWIVFVALHLARTPYLVTAVTRNDPVWLLIPLPLTVAALAKLCSCIRLIRHRRMCARGEFPQARRHLYLPDNFLLAACLMLVLLYGFGSGITHRTPMSEIYDDYVLCEGQAWPITIPDAVVTKPDVVSYRTFATRENWGFDGYIVMPDNSQGAIYINYLDFHSEFLAKWYAWELEHYYGETQVLQKGTEVWQIRSTVTIENLDTIFFERSEHNG